MGLIFLVVARQLIRNVPVHPQHPGRPCLLRREQCGVTPNHRHSPMGVIPDVFHFHSLSCGDQLAYGIVHVGPIYRLDPAAPVLIQLLRLCFRLCAQNGVHICIAEHLRRLAGKGLNPPNAHVNVFQNFLLLIFVHNMSIIRFTHGEVPPRCSHQQPADAPLALAQRLPGIIRQTLAAQLPIGKGEASAQQSCAAPFSHGNCLGGLP